MARKAFLRRFVSKMVPETADSTDGIIVGELTMEWGHPQGHFVADHVT